MAAAACVLAAPLFARPRKVLNPNSETLRNLPEKDQKTIAEGGIVVRALGGVSKMSLGGSNEGASRLADDLRALKPTYLAEVIETMPYEGNEDLPDRLMSILVDLDGYVSIPYKSSSGKIYDLYKSAKILSDETDESGGRTIRADIVMNPFETIETTITLARGGDFTRYSAVNDNDIRCRGIRCAKKRKMLSALLLTVDGGEWTLYAVCGAAAIRVPFLERRIRLSFLNRIKSFCDFVMEKLESEDMARIDDDEYENDADSGGTDGGQAVSPSICP